jgi:RND family efflux transporter MFP subunit
MTRKARAKRRKAPSARASTVRRERWLAARRLLVVLAVGCAGPPDEEIGDVSVVVSSDDVVVVQVGEIQAGPLLSGSLEPERSATLRAEMSGPVLRVYAEPGQSVSRGALLIQIEDAAEREALLSARAAATTSAQSEEAARRNVQRSRALFEAGAISQRQLEDAELALDNATAQRSDAEARVAAARSQLSRTALRAPFSGVVSTRTVNAGDVVQPGSELLTLVDPGSMRLEASIPSTDLAYVRVGTEAEFTVTGYGTRVFTGRVTRVTPTVDQATRQITVYVTIPNADGRLVGGLYAEGRLAAQSHTGPLVPYAAVDMDTAPETVLRLSALRVQRIPVVTGLRDDEHELIEIVTGLSEGDTVLVGAARALPPGTQVRILPPDSLGGRLRLR